MFKDTTDFDKRKLELNIVRNRHYRIGEERRGEERRGEEWRGAERRGLSQKSPLWNKGVFFYINNATNRQVEELQLKNEDLEERLETVEKELADAKGLLDSLRK